MQKETIEKYWAPFAAAIGAVSLVINFISTLQGNKTFATVALILVSLVAIVAGLWKYAFARSDKAFEKNGKFGFELKYKYHWVAKIAILLCTVSIVVSFGYILTVVGIVPDCCGIVPTPTATLVASPNTASPVTESAMPVFISTITATTAPTDNPVSTPTNPPSVETPSPTIISAPDIPDYFITDCIAFEVWYLWKRDKELSTRTNEQNRKCYDLIDWNLTAQKKEANSTVQGLRINIASRQNVMNGIFYPLGNEAQIKLSLDIEKLTSGIKCPVGEFCETNLVVGFGDPAYEGSGWFVVYRVLEKDAGIDTCLLRTAFTPCGNPITTELGNISTNHDLEFTLVGQDTYISIDGNLYAGPSIAGMRRQLWIGYQIRNSGSVNAFFEFK